MSVSALDLAAVIGVVGALGALFLLLAGPRRVQAAAPIDTESTPMFSALRAQALYERVAKRVGPALAAALIAGMHAGRLSAAVVVFLAMTASASMLWEPSHPLELTSVARVAFDALMPLLGFLLVIAAGFVAPELRLDGDTLGTALVGAWIVTFLSGWLERTFDASQPVRMAVVGEAGLAEALQREMTEAGVRSHRIVGYVSEGEHPVGLHANGNGNAHDHAEVRHLASVRTIRSAVRRDCVDLLVVAPQGSRIDLFKHVADSCLDLPVRMIEASSLYEQLHGRVPIGAINEAWFQYILHPRYAPGSPFTKRAVDVVVAMAVLLLALPLIAILAIGTRLYDGGPAFYRQRRVGEGGRDFDVLKLRTMHHDAEDPGQAIWSTPGDGRVTPLGRLLRQTHLDELPQVINVLRGEMSLVGPRPERPAFVAELEERIPHYQRRHLVRPGITGWAQVKSGYAGSHLGTAAKLSHDLYYLKHRSLLFDLVIITETVRTLFADRQFQNFTFSEAFILGDATSREESALLKEATSAVGS